MNCFNQSLSRDLRNDQDLSQYKEHIIKSGKENEHERQEKYSRRNIYSKRIE